MVCFSKNFWSVKAAATVFAVVFVFVFVFDMKAWDGHGLWLVNGGNVV